MNLYQKYKIYVDKEVENSIEEFKEFIKNETLAIEIIKKEANIEVDLNGHKVKIDVEVIKK